VDLSVLDTLALAQILDSDKIRQEGLRPRVEKARDTRTQGIAAAHAALETLGVSEKQLEHLVDAHVKDAAEKLRRSLKIP
jgi:mevalonate kinase